MAAKEFPEYKYNAGLKSGKGFLNFIMVVLIFAVIVVAINLTPLALVLLIAPVILLIKSIRSGSVNIILIANRYLIVGKTVVYYNNVEKVNLDRANGLLTLLTTEGKSVQIKASQFPTNARKPEKIQKNIMAKFNKTADKISAILKEISPGIVG